MGKNTSDNAAATNGSISNSLSSKKPFLLRDFFFAEETPFGMAITRMIVPLTVGFSMFWRFPRLRQLYTTDGSSTQLFELYGEGLVLPVPSPAVAVPLYGMMLLALLMASVGFRTRLSLFVATPLFVYFNLLDSVGTMTKYSVIGSHLLLLLALSNAGAVFSVDRWLSRKNSEEGNVLPPRFPIWPARLIQLLFCFIYFGAAITKIQTAAFFSGEQMRYWMLSNWNYDNPVGETMAMWSWLLPVSAYLAVVWEILFGFLVFQKRTRLIMLGMGALFHFMTWLTLGLYIFPAVCLSGYIAFISEKDFLYLRNVARRWKISTALTFPGRVAERLLQAIPGAVPPEVAWTCLLALSAISATELDYQFDLYGDRRADGPLQLEEVDAAVAQRMIRDNIGLREQDKFFSFELGTFMVGNQLANRREKFTYGELMIAQCNLNTPHEDLWVECVLQDEQKRTIEQFGHIVTRDKLRSNFTYSIGNKLLPGKYHMVLKSANREIYRREFELTGVPPKPQHDALLTN